MKLVVTPDPLEEEAQLTHKKKEEKKKKRWDKLKICVNSVRVCECVWTGMITCMCVCVTLAWPSGKVGRQESQCVSSQAFSLRLAGFITATNHWPDKSSYFILPSFTSALLFLFSSLFYFPKTSLPLFPPDSEVAFRASPCALPGSLSAPPPSLQPHGVTALFSVSSVFSPHCLSIFYTALLAPIQLFSYLPPLHLLLRSSLSLSLPSLPPSL